MGISIGSNLGSLQGRSGISLTARRTSLNQAVRNAGDLVDIARIADLALNDTTGILSRIRELTIQAGSGTLDVTERGDVQNEIAVLQAELDRLAHSSTALPTRRSLGTQALRAALAEWLGRESSVNLASTRERLVDADVATESSNLSRGIILSNASASVLVQANQHPRAALRLLAS